LLFILLRPPNEQGEFPGVFPIQGYFKVETHGTVTSNQAIIRAFDQFAALTKDGIVSQIPFRLSVKKVTSKGATAAETKKFPVVTLESILQMPELMAAEEAGLLQRQHNIWKLGLLSAIGQATGQQYVANALPPALPQAPAPQPAPETDVVEFEEVPAPQTPEEEPTNPLGVPLDPKKAFEYVRAQFTKEELEALAPRFAYLKEDKAFQALSKDEQRLAKEAALVKLYNAHDGDKSLIFAQGPA
jgi:hypothetical protein